MPSHGHVFVWAEQEVNKLIRKDIAGEKLARQVKQVLDRPTFDLKSIAKLNRAYTAYQKVINDVK